MSAHPTFTVISWISDLSNCSSEVFFLCHLGELMNYSNLYAHFFSDSRAREHFLEPTRMHEWKECYLETNFVWSCCWAQLELNGRGGVPNFMWLQRKISKLVCWGAPWLHSRCLDPNSMWVFWPWSAGLSMATEPAWKFLPSDLRQFIRMCEVNVVSRWTSCKTEEQSSDLIWREVEEPATELLGWQSFLWTAVWEINIWLAS